METTRRRFLLSALTAPAAAAFAVEGASAHVEDRTKRGQTTQPKSAGAYTLPLLPYGFDALEPYVDRQTMQLHHDKHHQTYVTNLNGAVAKYPDLQRKSAAELIRDLQSVPEDVRATVRNNAGGHVNHSMFWPIMQPRGQGGGGEPTGAIADAIKNAFGGFATFKERFNDAGAKRFGAGWVWLVRTRDGKLDITSSPNQDNPVMEGAYPVMGNDVWEHAYYLKYQNRRADYLAAWWNTVNWTEVNQRLAQAS